MIIESSFNCKNNEYDIDDKYEKIKRADRQISEIDQEKQIEELKIVEDKSINFGYTTDKRLNGN